MDLGIPLLTARVIVFCYSRDANVTPPGCAGIRCCGLVLCLMLFALQIILRRKRGKAAAEAWLPEGYGSSGQAKWRKKPDR